MPGSSKRNTAKKVARIALGGAAFGVITRALENAYHTGTKRMPTGDGAKGIGLKRYADAAGKGAFMGTGLYGAQLLTQKVPGWLRNQNKSSVKANKNKVVHHVFVYAPSHKQIRKKKKKISR